MTGFFSDCPCVECCGRRTGTRPYDTLAASARELLEAVEGHRFGGHDTCDTGCSARKLMDRAAEALRTLLDPTEAR